MRPSRWEDGRIILTARLAGSDEQVMVVYDAEAIEWLHSLINEAKQTFDAPPRADAFFWSKRMKSRTRFVNDSRIVIVMRRPKCRTSPATRAFRSTVRIADSDH